MKSLFIFATLFSISTHTLAAKDTFTELKEALAKQIPDAKDAVISKSPIDNVYQVDLKGQVLYLTGDKKHLIMGDIFELDTRKNLTELTRSTARMKLLGNIKEDEMLVFKPQGENKHTITVFTDTQCPYCRKLHNDIDSYLKEGIKVRYIFTPFKGDPSFNQAVSIWCSKNPQTAYTDVSNGKEVETKTCDNPISKHQSLAYSIGVQGTPAIVLEDGTLLPGYVPAAKLMDQLKQRGL